MKKLATAFTTSLASISLFADKVFAQSAGFFSTPGGEATGITVASQQTLGQNIIGIVNFFLGLLGLIAVAFLIYAGVLMVTAGGNEEQVGKARKIITYAVVGIVIILLSYSIVTFVTGALG